MVGDADFVLDSRNTPPSTHALRPAPLNKTWSLTEFSAGFGGRGGGGGRGRGGPPGRGRGGYVLPFLVVPDCPCANW